ncbi:hypothetical protein BKA62DRAFT_831228 [Auriculariales sp. MPI-PUGE-AT-0066]|nr:hypothetical protein BKA62DRAFT_831228 [Auriculariales sp. MPI-PUGE-AT-0066]
MNHQRNQNSQRALPSIRDILPQQFHGIPAASTPPPPTHGPYGSTPLSPESIQRHGSASMVPTHHGAPVYPGQPASYPHAHATTPHPPSHVPVPVPTPASPSAQPQALPPAIDAHTCPICGRRFDRPSTMRIHANSHTGDKPYTCSVCGRAYTCSSNLYRHQRRCDSCSGGRDQQPRR